MSDEHKTNPSQEHENGLDNQQGQEVLETMVVNNGEQQENSQAEIPGQMPLLAVRDIVVFN